MAALAAAILLAACGAPSPSATIAPSSPPSSPPSGGSCPSEHVTIVVHAGDPLTIEQCVHEGTGIELTFNLVAGYRWSTVDSSDHSRCVVSSSRVNPDGSGHSVLGAVKSGEVDITASLSPTTDANGPPTRRWMMHLRILPSPVPMG